MEWELSKENYQPLKGGRDPTTLSVDAASSSEKSGALEAQKRYSVQKGAVQVAIVGEAVLEGVCSLRQLNADIEEYSGPDPLEPWLRLIKWTQEHFKAGGHKAELLPLLERCTRELQDKDSYKDDIRYLRVWIQYDNDIGQDLALFYIAYAAYLELRGNYSRAEAVFKTGREKMALPVQKLQTKFDAFKERMARRQLRQLQDAADFGGGQPLTEEQGVAGREALGVLKSKTRRGGLAVRPSQPSTATDKENAEASGLEVFVDDEFAGSGRARSAGLGAQGTGAWEQLASFESTRKENQQRPAKWKGNKFKQKRELMPVPDPSLEIPEDEDLKDVQPVFQKAPKGTLQQRAGIGRSRDIEERLLHDPLRLFKDPSQVPAQLPRESSEVGPPNAQANNDTISESGTAASDMSFEELRAAARYTTRADATLQIRDKTPTDHVASASNSREGNAAIRSAEIEAVPRDVPPSQDKEADGLVEKDPRCRASADLTIATRAAFDSVNGMFRGALPHDFSWDGRGDPTATIRVGEATVTLSSRAAFDAVNSMFQATLPNEAGQNAANRRPRSATVRLRRADSHVSCATLAHDEETGALQVYEDTEFFPGDGRSNRASSGRARGDDTEAFVSYVDTEFLNASGETTDMRPRNGRRSGIDQTTAFVVYQDTELLPGGGSGSGAAAAHEAQRPTSEQFHSDQENLAPSASRH